MSIDAGGQVAIILLTCGPCVVIVIIIVGTGYVLLVELPVQGDSARFS